MFLFYLRGVQEVDAFNKSFLGAGVFLLITLVVVLGFGSYASQRETSILREAAGTVVGSRGVIVTSSFREYHGMVYFDGRPAIVGSIISAYDPDGIWSGAATVLEAGRYSNLRVYGDDSQTVRDEGALYGDIIHFYVNGELAPQTSVWSSGGNEALNLSASRRSGGSPFIIKTQG